jgi:hypothetical protein
VNYFYWDASTLVKRYAPEIGTSVVNHLFAHVVLDRMMCLVIGTDLKIIVGVRASARLEGSVVSPGSRDVPAV